MEDFFQAHHVARCAPGFQVGVVHRHIKVGQVQLRHLRAFGLGHVGSGRGQLAVVRLGTCAAREYEEGDGCGHASIVAHPVVHAGGWSRRLEDKDGRIGVCLAGVHRAPARERHRAWQLFHVKHPLFCIVGRRPLAEPRSPIYVVPPGI